MLISHPDREFKPKYAYYFHVENGLAAYDSEEKLEVGSVIIVDGFGTYSLKITRIWTSDEKEFIEYESFKTIVCRPKFLPLEEMQRTFKFPKPKKTLFELALTMIYEGYTIDKVVELTGLTQDDIKSLMN